MVPMVTEAWTLAGCGGAASKPAAAAQEVPALLHPAAKKPTSLRAVAVASNVSQDGRRDASAAVVGRRRGIASCLLATPALAGASSGSAARAAILEADDDLELLERVKEDKKKRLQKQGIINSSAPETGPGVQAELVLAGRGQGDSSTRETDELLWAATWLHLASSPSPNSQGEYMSYINSNGHTLGAEQDGYTVSWDDKRAATKVLLSKVLLQNRVEGLRAYKAHADKYICSLVPGAGGFQSQYTPGGLLFKEGDSNMEYVTSTAFLLLTYAKYLSSTGGAASCGSTAVTPSTLVSLAKKQVDYILGANPAGMSYMVGFGARYPRRVHHRGASMPSVRDHPGRIGCDEGFQYLHSSDPDRNVLVGAVVGGPDQSDSYSDSRDNYAQAEPSTYTNAPLVGVLAFFAGARTA